MDPIPCHPVFWSQSHFAFPLELERIVAVGAVSSTLLSTLSGLSLPSASPSLRGDLGCSLTPLPPPTKASRALPGPSTTPLLCPYRQLHGTLGLLLVLLHSARAVPCPCRQQFPGHATRASIDRTLRNRPPHTPPLRMGLLSHPPPMHTYIDRYIRTYPAGTLLQYFISTHHTPLHSTGLGQTLSPLPFDFANERWTNRTLDFNKSHTTTGS